MDNLYTAVIDLERAKQPITQKQIELTAEQMFELKKIIKDTNQAIDRLHEMFCKERTGK